MTNRVIERNSISLNGVQYPIIGKVQPQIISQFPNKIVIGDTNRSDQQFVSEWVISDLTGGMLIENMDEREHADRFWNSSGVWTLDPSQIHLGPLVQTLGTTCGTGGVKVFRFGSKTYAVDASTLKRWNTSNEVWDTVLTASGTIFDFIVFTNAAGTKELYVTAGANYYHSTSGDSGSWTTDADDAYWFAEFDRKLITADATNIKYSTDGAAWTTLLAHGKPWSPNAVATMRSPETREEMILLAFRDGVYTVDFWTGKMYKWLDFSGAVYENNGRRMIVWRDEVYIPAQYQLLRVSGSTAVNIGLTKDDGLHSDLSAKIGQLAPLGDWLFASTSNLFVWNGRGWHKLYESAGIVEDILTQSDMGASDTLVKLYMIDSDDGTDEFVRYIELPATGLRPLKVSTFPYAASGWLETPYFDGGFRDWPKVGVSIKVTCRGMSANEKITVKYKKDAESSFTTLGSAIVSTGLTTLSFASGAGLEFKKMQLRFDFARGSTTTKTPILESAVLRYYRVPDTLYGWRATIDCTKPYNGYEASQLVTALHTAIETSTLVIYQHMPDSDKYVKIMNMSGLEEAGQGREGRYQVFLAEMA